MVIQVGRAALERGGHGGAVELREEVVCEVAGEIQREQRVHLAARHGRVRLRGDHERTIGRGDRGEKLGADATGPGAMSRRGRRFRCLEEAPDQVPEGRVAARRAKQRRRPGEDAAEARRQAAEARRQAPAEIRRVAREQLVPALPHQHDLHLGAREAREQEGRHECRVGERLVEERHEVPEAFEEELGRDGERPVARPERAGDQRRMLALVEARDVEAEREGGELAVHRGPRQSRDRRRVESAGKEEAERHITHQRRPDGAREVGAERFGRGLEVERERGCGEERRHLPVAVHGEPLALEHEAPAGGQLHDVAEGARRRRHESGPEIDGERIPVGCVRDRAAGEQRLRLRGEEEAVGRRRVVERLLAQAIAGEDEAAAACVPHRQAEHPVERVDEV